MSSNIVSLEPEFVNGLLWANDIVTKIIAPLLIGILDEDLAFGVIVVWVLRDWDITRPCNRTSLKSSACSSQSLLYQVYLAEISIALFDLLDDLHRCSNLENRARIARKFPYLGVISKRAGIICSRQDSDFWLVPCCAVGQFWYAGCLPPSSKRAGHVRSTTVLQRCDDVCLEVSHASCLILCISCKPWDLP